MPEKAGNKFELNMLQIRADIYLAEAAISAAEKNFTQPREYKKAQITGTA